MFLRRDKIKTEHEQFLEDALDHIVKIARNSRTSSKRLRWIQKRAEDALLGIPYKREEFELPKMKTLSANQYERLLKDREKEIAFYKEMSFIERIVWAIKGEKR